MLSNTVMYSYISRTFVSNTNQLNTKLHGCQSRHRNCVQAFNHESDIKINI